MGPVFGFCLFSVLAILIIIFKYLLPKNESEEVGSTWDCGSDLTPRMEITATGFSHSIITVFKGLLRPSIQHDIEYHDAESRYLPRTRKVTLRVSDVYQSYFYKPLNILTNDLFKRATNIQSGNINLYILYVFIALIVALYWVL